MSAMVASNPAACCTAGILTLLSVMHLYWACGGQRGKLAVIPQDEDAKPLIRPSRLGTLSVAIALLLAAAVVFTAVSVTGIFFLAALFLLRAIGDFRTVGFCKRVRTTRFARWDMWLYSPISLLISIGCLASTGKY